MRLDIPLRSPRIFDRCRRPAIALSLVIAGCFSDSGLPDSASSAASATGSTGATIGTESTSTSTSTTTATTTSTTSTATTAIAPTTSTSGPVGTSSTSSTSTGGDACTDPGPEPNEDEDSATVLEALQCNGSPKTSQGVLAGSDDVDWYTLDANFPGSCPPSAPEDPVLAVALDPDQDLRLCVYPKCIIGAIAEFTCPPDSVGVSTPKGVSGCCGAAALAFEAGCVGTPNESLRVLVLVDQAPPDACVAYQLTYGFAQM